MTLEGTDIVYLEKATELVERLATIKLKHCEPANTEMTEMIGLLTKKVLGFIKQIRTFE